MNRLSYKWLVLMVLLPGLTVITIDLTVVNVALAKLGAVYGISVDTVQWAITAYALATGIATPLAGYVENRFTIKPVWVVGLSVFTAASVLCGLSPAFWILVLGRLAQGFSSGLLLPMVISLIFRVFPPAERGGALGFFAIPIVAGPALGPTIGGYIITNWDWRLVFFINLPIGIISVILGALLLQTEPPKRGGRFDVWGFAFSSLGFGLTLYGFSQVSSRGWGSLPLYLQNLRGLSAVDTGLILMPQGLSIALAGPVAGRLVDRIGPRWIVMFGFILMAANTYQLSQITLTTDYGTLRWLLVLRGLALGCTMQPTTLTALAAVPSELQTNASSLVTAMRSVWQSFGVALLSTVVQTQTLNHSELLSWQVRPDTAQGGVRARRALGH